MRIGAVVLVCLAVAGCAAREDQTVSDIKSARQAWLGCVLASYSHAVKRTPDRNLAAEQAFISCQTEERSIYALASPDIYLEAVSKFSAVKADVKQKLVTGEAYQMMRGQR